MMHHNDEIQDASKSFYREVVIRHIQKNKDRSVKETGDTVLMWDTSRLREIDTGETNTDVLDHAMLCMFPSIVIEHGLRINADIVLDDRVYPCNLDIMIWNKTLGKKFYTSSEFVKITTDKV